MEIRNWERWPWTDNICFASSKKEEEEEKKVLVHTVAQLTQPSVKLKVYLMFVVAVNPKLKDCLALVSHTD